jgi:hypothetical protein
LSGELKITTSDGTTYWFGRDDHFPEEVRIYGADTRHWAYMSTNEARQIVRQSLTDDGQVQQGDAERFFLPDAGADIGD